MYISYESLIIGITTFVLIIITIRASKMRIKDAIFWIIWTLTLAIFAFTPEATNWIKHITGVYNHDVYLFFLIILFSYFLMLRHTMILSQHEDKIKEISQNIAISQLEQKKVNKEIMELLENGNNK